MEDFNYFYVIASSAVGMIIFSLLGCLFEYIYNRVWKFKLFHGLAWICVFFIGLILAESLILYVPLLVAGYPIYYIVISNLTKNKEERKELPTSFGNYLDFMVLLYKNIKSRLVDWYDEYIAEE